MKHIEQIKSLLLTFLVLLSITFTLLIWNYKPDYNIIEETQVEDVLIKQPKQLQDVLKPYRVLYRQDNQFFGTVSPNVFNNLYSHLISWQTNEIELINYNISDEKMNEILRENNRVTLFFNEEIPLQTFSNILTFTNKDLPQLSFTRLLIDWSNLESSNQLQLLFLNTEKRILLRGYVDLFHADRFIAEVIEPASDYSTYVEVERESAQSLYITENPTPATRYTYVMEEISLDLFKEIVFPEPNIVQRTIEGDYSERYSDDTSLMNVDTRTHIINYVYPFEESIAPILSSKLLIDSFDYVNDHGGFTADYRFTSMNVDKHIVEYQLFLHGLPIYSNMTTTRIVTTWGENRIYRYRRPYYLIEMNFERAQKELASGEEVIEYIRTLKDYPFKEVKEVVMGYYLIQDDVQDSYVLEPSWFAITNNASNGWTRLVPERIGGNENGLE